MKQVKENTIRNCTFANNIAKVGGALHIDHIEKMATASIEHCAFIGNKGVIYEEQPTNMGMKVRGHAKSVSL